MEDNKSRWLGVKRKNLEQRTGLPMEPEEIHKCMSDMVHILSAGSTELLNQTDVPVATDILTHYAQLASNGINTGKLLLLSQIMKNKNTFQ